MKRWIHAATLTNPVQHQGARSALDRIWNSAEGDKEYFMGMIDRGIGNSDLPKSLFSFSDSELLSLAEEYANYRIALDNNYKSKHAFDVDSVTDAITAMVSANSNIPMNVKLQQTRIYTKNMYLEYILSSQEYPCNETDPIAIILEPDTQFIGLDPKDQERIENAIEYVETTASYSAMFIQNYSALLDTFYGEYLGVPKSKYKDYIRCSYYEENGPFTIWFEYASAYDVSKLLYSKGYIEEPYTSDAEELLKPLLNSYGLELDEIFNFITKLR